MINHNSKVTQRNNINNDENINKNNKIKIIISKYTQIFNHTYIKVPQQLIIKKQCVYMQLLFKKKYITYRDKI